MFVLIRQQDPFLSSPIWQLQVSENVQLQPMMSLHNAMLTDQDESWREGETTESVFFARKENYHNF